MKKYIVLVLAAGVFSCQQKEGGKTVPVDGLVKNTTAKMVYLEENTPNGRPTILDSATVKEDGRFALKQKPRKKDCTSCACRAKQCRLRFLSMMLIR
jgi:hypothetical protein